MNISKVIIIKTANGQKYADFIAKEVNLRGCQAHITDIKNIKGYLKKQGHSPDGIVIHTRTAHPKYTYQVLKEIEGQGYKVVNKAESIKLTSDKYDSCVFARENNISCAEAVKVSKKEAVLLVKQKVEEWEEVVVKPVTSQGQGKFCFKFNKNSMGQIKEIEKIPSKELVIQKFVNYQRLNRVIVIGGSALEKAVFWDEPGNDWKCSVCLNPKIKVYRNPPQELLNFAEDAAKKFKAEISFVDVFTTKSGYVLSELNTACSLIIHERVSGYNISKKIADYLIDSR